MANMQGCRDYWNGYRNGKAEIATYGAYKARERYNYGYCGNGSFNYYKGFRDAINKSIAKLENK